MDLEFKVKSRNIILIKNEDKSFLKNFIIQKKYLSEDEYEKQSNKLENWDINGTYWNIGEPEKLLENKDYNHFMYEVFYKWAIDTDFKNVLYIGGNLCIDKGLLYVTDVMDKKEVIFNETSIKNVYFDTSKKLFYSSSKRSKELCDTLNLLLAQTSEVVLEIQKLIEKVE